MYQKLNEIIILAGVFLFQLCGHAGLLFEDDFESGTISSVDPTIYPDNLPINTWYMSWWNQPNSSAPIQVVSSENPIRHGSHSLLITMQRVNDNKSRSEIGVNIPYNGETERWYGFSMYIPNQDFAAAKLDKVVVAQFGNWKENPGLPDFALRVTPTEFWITQEHPGVPYLQWQSPLIVDQWVDWVFHINWTSDSTGFFRTWKNGVLVLDLNGPTTDGTANSIKSKIGLYWGSWQNEINPSLTTLVAYFDDYRVGDASSSYDEVKPVQEFLRSSD